jgi:hypothetical protein
LVVGFRAGLHVFDGDFYNEFSATDILLGPGDLCSHVILVERRPSRSLRESRQR